MYFVVEFAGHQNKVKKGDVLTVNNQNLEESKTIKCDKVLAKFSEDGKTIDLGAPYVEGAAVTFKVLSNQKGKKQRVFKMKPKKRYRINKGARQHETTLEVTAVK